MKSNTKRTSLFEDLLNVKIRDNNISKDIEVNCACDRNLKYMQHEIYDEVGDEEMRL